jgi:hypothetical protein
MHFSCKVRVLVGFCLLTALTSYASSAENKFYIKSPDVPIEFSVHEVSCTNESTPEMLAETKKWQTNPQGDLYFMAYANDILKHERKVADAGDVGSMYNYGAAMYEIIILTSKFGDPIPETEYLPDSFKSYVVSSAVYLYLASFDANQHEKAISGIKRMLGRREYFNIPQVWLEEAKKKADDWKEYCKNKTA